MNLELDRIIWLREPGGLLPPSHVSLTCLYLSHNENARAYQAARVKRAILCQLCNKFLFQLLLRAPSSPHHFQAALPLTTIESFLSIHRIELTVIAPATYISAMKYKYAGGVILVLVHMASKDMVVVWII